MFRLLDALHGLSFKVQIMFKGKLLINKLSTGEAGVQQWRMLCIPLISILTVNDNRHCTGRGGVYNEMKLRQVLLIRLYRENLN